MYGASGLMSLPVSGIEPAQLDPGPEGAEGEVSAPIRHIDAERVDGVEIVAIFRHEHEALIPPPLARLCRIEGRVGHEPDGARVMSEARQAIIEEDRASPPADRGRPDGDRRKPERRLSPCGRALADQARIGPLDPVRRGLDADRAMRRPLLSGADSDKLAADLDDRRIVDAQVAGHLRLRLRGPRGSRRQRSAKASPAATVRARMASDVDKRRTMMPAISNSALARRASHL